MFFFYRTFITILHPQDSIYYFISNLLHYIHRTQFNKLYTHPLFSIIHTAAVCTYPVQPICTFSCTSVFLLIFIIHSILYCTFYLIAHLTHCILLFVPFFILTYIYIFSCVMFHCFIAYVIFILFSILLLLLIFIFLHFPLSGPVLTYISLLIIPCMIVYVTNNKEPNT